MAEPEQWGPHFWRTIEYVAWYFPDAPSEDEIKAAKNFLLSLIWLLPCDECSVHFSEYLTENPVEPHLTGRQAFTKWVYDFHSAVNKRLGKTNQPSYQQVRAKYLELEPKYKVSPMVSQIREQNALKAEIETRQQQFNRLRSRSADSAASSTTRPKAPFGRQIANPGVGAGKKGCVDCAKKRLARGRT